MSLSLDGPEPGFAQALFACPVDGCDYAVAASTAGSPHCHFHPEVELFSSNGTYGRALCRTCPAISLDNSDSFIIRLDAQLDREDITSVDYELHLPPGVSVTDFVKLRIDEKGDYSEADDCAVGYVVLVTMYSELDVLVMVNVEYNGMIFHTLGRTNEAIRTQFELLVA